MEKKRIPLTIVILENRQMIATILSDLLTGAGYETRILSRTEMAGDILPECQPGLLLVDLGMLRTDQQGQWQELQESADSYNIPVLTFSCSALPDLAEDVLVLRSPRDFASVVDRIEQACRRKQPFLGMTLVQMGLLDAGEVEVALRVQRELAQVGRAYPLGDLLVRLGMICPEDLQKALQEQDL